VEPVSALVAARTELGLLDLVVAGDWLIHAGRATLAQVRQALAEAKGRDCRKARRAGELVRDRVESPRETRLRLVIALSGLPEPECNVDLGDEWFFIARVDLYLREWDIAVEYEGDQHRTDSRVHARDLKRYEALAASGVLPVRVAKDHLRHPCEVAWRIFDALVSRGYDGPPPSFGPDWRTAFGVALPGVHLERWRLRASQSAETRMSHLSARSEQRVTISHVTSLPLQQRRLPSGSRSAQTPGMHSDDLNPRYDVVVIGGGAAGLNGALMLARSRRSVVVIDAGEPRNAPADGVHGLLAREGMPPSELLERGRAEVRSYGAAVVAGVVTSLLRAGDGFVVRLGDGRTVEARRLLITTGLADELPDIPGLRERWGRDVIHCPYCHGWEVRDRPIGVLATGPMVTHQALLLRQLSEDVVVLTHTAAISAEDRERMRARGIRLVDGEVVEVRIGGDRIVGVTLAGGEIVDREVLAVQSRMVARSGFLADLGLATTEHPMGGAYVPADPAGQTSVRGVYVAGNVTDLAAQVGAAAAGGAFVAARINADLVEEDTDAAVRTLRTAVPA
jgi:thioredoxin reductase